MFANRLIVISTFFHLVLLGICHADSQPAQSFQMKIEGRTVEFMRMPEKHLTISRNCVKKELTPQCEAYSAYQKAASQVLAPTAKRGGRNPGAVLCGKIGGKVVVAVDESGNQQSFCAFQDQSYVSTGSLTGSQTTESSKAIR